MLLIYSALIRAFKAFYLHSLTTNHRLSKRSQNERRQSHNSTTAPRLHGISWGRYDNRATVAPWEDSGESAPSNSTGKSPTICMDSGQTTSHRTPQGRQHDGRKNRPQTVTGSRPETFGSVTGPATTDQPNRKAYHLREPIQQKKQI